MIRPAAFPPALWHIAAPPGELAELSIAARIFARARGGVYVGRHRKANRRGTVRFGDITNEVYAEVVADA